MPDEQSNLNSPRRPAGAASRRRGRRGGRGRARASGPRPPAEKAPGEISPASETMEDQEAPETGEETAAPAGDTETHEPEADTSGGFRTPHAEVPEEFASHSTAGEEPPPSEPAAEAAPEPPRATEPRREERREERRDDRREERRDPRYDERRDPRHDERRENRPPPPRVAPAQRQWARPADFRPAEDTAIHEAVAHATFIASALKELHDQMDEILELVEVAERQKLADERELEELRRALRRIQPQQRPQQQQSYRHQPRRDEPRPASPEEAPPAD